MKKFSEKGEGFGEALYFQGMAVQELLECQKTINNCGNHVNIENFNHTLLEQQGFGQDLLDKNERLYHQATPQPGSIKIEKKDMMNPILPEDLFIGENKKKFKDKYNELNNGLDSLIPQSTREQINNFKRKIDSYLRENIGQCESEKTILFYIQNLRLPMHLTQRKKAGENDIGRFPIPLWEKIQKVQQMGGIMGLSGKMQAIMNKSNYLINQLSRTLNSFKKEEEDDNQQRQKYGDNRWIRKPSKDINFKYIGTIQNYIQNLQNTSKFDQKQNDDILNNSQKFELLGQSKEKLESNIPGDKEGLNNLSSDEERIKNEIDKLYNLSDKCMELINPIYEILNNDEVIIPLFVDVLEMKTTEDAVYKKFIDENEPKIAKLKEITQEVKNQKNEISTLVQKYGQKIYGNNGYGISEEAKKYFHDIEEKVKSFMHINEKIQKGESYYNNLYQKIDEVIKASNKWMISRNEEKKALIDAINKGQI
jgi:hypothetical protein